MTFGGWIVLLLSVGSTTALFAWCVFKVVTTPGETEKLHGFEQEPPDVARQEQADHGGHRGL